MVFDKVFDVRAVKRSAAEEAVRGYQAIIKKMFQELAVKR
jgi:hypothetical protein